jgi:hypothetical protein
MPSARGGVAVVAALAVVGVVFVAFGPLSSAEAYSTGAGQCIGGMAAVGAPHMTATAVTGPLSDASLVVAVNNRVFNVSEIGNFYVETGTDYTILIQAQDGSFRGALIRASSDDGAEFTLEPGVNGQVASVCTDPGVLGVTHTSNDLKTELGATLNIAVAGTIVLDVTVVQSQNANDGSVYFYTPYALTATDTLPDVPTIEPVDLPATPSSPFNGTTAPPPSVTPIVSNVTMGSNETEAPGTTETESPGGSNETEAPAMIETAAPGMNETEAPGMNETEAPGMNETMPPATMNETMPPAMNETMAPVMNETMPPAAMNETMAPTTTTAMNETNSTTENESQAPIGTPPPMAAPTMPKSPVAPPTAKSQAAAPATTAKLWWTSAAALAAIAL